MEQDQEVREQEQVEAVAAVEKEAVEVLAGVKAVAAEAREAVLVQGRVVIAFARIVAKGPPINWGPPAMTSNVLSAAQP